MRASNQGLRQIGPKSTQDLADGLVAVEAARVKAGDEERKGQARSRGKETNVWSISWMCSDKDEAKDTTVFRVRFASSLWECAPAFSQQKCDSTQRLGGENVRATRSATQPAARMEETEVRTHTCPSLSPAFLSASSLEGIAIGDVGVRHPAEFSPRSLAPG